MAKRKKDGTEFIGVARRMLKARADRLAETLGDDVRVSELHRALFVAWLEGVDAGLKATDAPPAPFSKYPGRG